MRGISFGDYRQMPFDADPIRAQPLSLLVTIATLRQNLFKRAQVRKRVEEGPDGLIQFGSYWPSTILTNLFSPNSRLGQRDQAVRAISEGGLAGLASLPNMAKKLRKSYFVGAGVVTAVEAAAAVLALFLVFL